MGTARRAAARAAIAGAIAAACASSAAAQTRLEARAIDVAKAGRWTAVQVLLDHSGPELAGELILSWGDRELRRHVSLVSSGRHQFDLYTRTPAADSSLRVRLVAGETEVTAIDVKMKVVSQDEAVTLCLVAAGNPAPDAACSATVPVAGLPASHRGYEVVDRVVWPPGRGPDTWPAAQRLAYQRWELLRELDRRGALGLAPGVSRPVVEPGLPIDTSRTVAAGSAAYCLLFVMIGLVLRRSRAGLTSVAAAMLALTTIGAAGAYAVGRVGTPPVVVHHESLLQQLPGTLGSLLTVQAVAEFPAFDRFSLRLASADGSLETVTRSGRLETTDDEGYPVLAGTFGLGTRRAFSAEAAIPVQLLDVTEERDVVRITNRSNVDLTGCRFADGFSTTTPADLKPSASAQARRPVDVIGPAFTCALPEPVVSLTESRRPVRMSGRMVLAAYLAEPPHREAADD